MGKEILRFPYETDQDPLFWGWDGMVRIVFYGDHKLVLRIFHSPMMIGRRDGME